MENFLASVSLVAKMATDDYVGFTFFVGCMAMMAAAAFFFLSMNSFDKKWRTSILVSGLITFIAAVHYWYMRDYWATNMDSPTFFRYVDWILTVPLMCVEFFLILKVAGIAYFAIVYEIWLGNAKKLAVAAGGEVLKAHKILCWFVLVGWAIYPIGYMAGTPGWYEGIFGGLAMDVVYNIGDAINKIGFGLVVYNLAVVASAKAEA